MVVFVSGRFLMPQTRPEREGTSFWVLRRRTPIRSADVWMWNVLWRCLQVTLEKCRTSSHLSVYLIVCLPHLFLSVLINFTRNTVRCRRDSWLTNENCIGCFVYIFALLFICMSKMNYSDKVSYCVAQNRVLDRMMVMSDLVFNVLVFSLCAGVFCWITLWWSWSHSCQHPGEWHHKHLLQYNFILSL